MKTETQQMNIYQNLAKIRKRVEIMKKDAKAYGCTYPKEESILAKITVYMERHDLSLLPGIA